MPSLGGFGWGFGFAGGLVIWSLRIDVWDSCTFLVFWWVLVGGFAIFLGFGFVGWCGITSGGCFWV